METCLSIAFTQSNLRAIRGVRSRRVERPDSGHWPREKRQTRAPAG
jgi:hypothetical protein